MLRYCFSQCRMFMNQKSNLINRSKLFCLFTPTLLNYHYSKVNIKQEDVIRGKEYIKSNVIKGNVQNIQQRSNNNDNNNNNTNNNNNKSIPLATPHRWWLKYVIGIPLFSFFFLYQYTKYHFLRYITPQQQTPQPTIYSQQKQSYKIIRLFKYILRFIHLALIFLPSLLTLPLALFQKTFDWWMTVFLWSIQNAGVVWIKAFQYLSHRRDVIGPELAEKFGCLRENSPQHKEKSTKEIFKRVYGVNIDQLFDQFDYQPIASGSISQVYKAKFQGKKIALKVRHPNVQKNIQRDIDILFFFSKVFSVFSKRFQIPINSHSLKKILIDQVYFTRESKNLKKFNRIMRNPDVKFPIPYPQTNDQVLVQSFVQGLPITFYVDHPHKLNSAIAMIGASTFFQMMMKHNFVHADCHGGNIYVRIQPNIKPFRIFHNWFKNIQNFIISHVIKISFQSPLLKRLAQQNYQYQKKVNQILQKSKSTVQITLLDVGMVIHLNQNKKKAFRDFLKQIVKGDAKNCAQMIYNISRYRNNDLKNIKQKNIQYLKDLQEMFSIVENTELQDLQGIQVLNGMLKVIRKHNMKIDGEISILFTNMLVLEAIAKELDPEINVLRCAIPYLVQQTVEEYTWVGQIKNQVEKFFTKGL